jgi:hypothetical protein
MKDLFKKIFREEVTDDDISIDVSESEGVRSLHFCVPRDPKFDALKKTFSFGAYLYKSHDDVSPFSCAPS